MSFTIPAQVNTPYNPNIIVQDNFLDDSYCELLCEHMGVRRPNFFPWYYGEVIPYNSDTDRFCSEVAPPNQNWQFSHRFYELNVDQSKYCELIQPLVDVINPDVLYKVKANLNTHYLERIVHGYHTDIHAPGCTSIFYLNDNNGVTIFKYTDTETGEEKYQEVESKRGRLVTFDNRTMHSGTSTTDTPFRLVINLNYYKHDFFHENS